jgi:hypothetical protein
VRLRRTPAKDDTLERLLRLGGDPKQLEELELGLKYSVIM